MINQFSARIEQALFAFTPYLSLPLKLQSPLFSASAEKVEDFVQEIRTTMTLLISTTETVYVEFYADRIVKQFYLLEKAVRPYAEKKNTFQPFVPSYRFSPDIHHLPPKQRLIEYQKALRVLNEKISYLTERLYYSEAEQCTQIQQQIKETEQRKQRCLNAIDQLNCG